MCVYMVWVHVYVCMCMICICALCVHVRCVYVCVLCAYCIVYVYVWCVCVYCVYVWCMYCVVCAYMMCMCLYCTYYDVCMGMRVLWCACMEVRLRHLSLSLSPFCDSLLVTSAMHQAIWPRGFWEASCLYVLAIGVLILQRIQLTQALGIQALVCTFARQVFPQAQSIALRSP